MESLYANTPCIAISDHLVFVQSIYSLLSNQEDPAGVEDHPGLGPKREGARGDPSALAACE